MGRRSSDAVAEYVKLLEDKGYPVTLIDYSRRLIHKFMKRYKDDFSEENILEFDFEIAETNACVNPALLIWKYKEYAESGIMPDIHTRKRGIKDGYSRPANCRRDDCKYNAYRRCRYRPMDNLDRLLVWKNCTFYEERKKERVPIAPKEPAVYHDSIFGRTASYMDSHSVRYSE